MKGPPALRSSWPSGRRAQHLSCVGRAAAMWASAARPSCSAPAAQPTCFALPVTSPGASHAQTCPDLTTGPNQPGSLGKLLGLIRVQPLEASSLVPANVRGAVCFPSGRVTSTEDLRVGLLKALDIGLAQFPLKYRSFPLAALEAKRGRQGAPMQHPLLQHRAGRL